jgi:protein TonB
MTHDPIKKSNSYPDDREGRSKLIRFGFGIPIAGGVTLGLGLIMAALIATEFTPVDKVASVDFSINPVPEDLKILEERTKPEPLKVIEIPPAPPTISTLETTKISPAPVANPQVNDVFKPVIFTIPRAKIVQANRNPDPLLRVPPAMPTRADRSGHCDVRLNVDSTGSPYQVEAIYCTQALFERPTVKAVAKWKYRPRIVDGRAVAMEGLTNRVSFHLMDDKGTLIPE